MVMDGFMKGGSQSGASPSKNHKINEASNLLLAKNASIKIKSAAQGVHKGAQRSQTLMRTAVKKPALAAKTANAQLRHPSVKPRSAHMDSARHNRVQAINKNTKVRRFGHGVSANSSKPVQQKAEVGEIVSHAPRSNGSAAKSLIHKPLPSMVASASHQQLERLLDEALTRADAHKRGRRRYTQGFKRSTLAKYWHGDNRCRLNCRSYCDE
jgi:hypothetical protein